MKTYNITVESVAIVVRVVREGGHKVEIRYPATVSLSASDINDITEFAASFNTHHVSVRRCAGGGLITTLGYAG